MQMYKKNYKIANHTTNVNKNAKFDSCLFAKFKTALRTVPKFWSSDKILWMVKQMDHFIERMVKSL